MIELRLGGELGVEHRPLAGPGARDQSGQPMIGLRPDHHVDPGRAAQHLGAFGLGQAAGDHHHGRIAGSSVRGRATNGPSPCPQPSDLRIDLLGGLLADMAGVQDDHVGVLGRIGTDVA